MQSSIIILNGVNDGSSTSDHLQHADQEDVDLPEVLDFECGDEQDSQEFTTLCYQRLKRAEESWLKLREAMLSTTFQNQGSLVGKKCVLCDSLANCCCLDCSPTMSLCESCAVSNHTNRNIFHNVEIFSVSNLFYHYSTADLHH